MKNAIAVRRVGAVVLTVIAAAVLTPARAEAAATGYVRLAHLSPDTPSVDVYLTSASGAIAPKTFPGVGYGVVSTYLPLPAGAYTVAMRKAGAEPTVQPVLSTTVTVAADGAYTVAGVGRYAELGLKVIQDDLSKPTAGNAKLRVVHASVRLPKLSATTAGGAPFGPEITFATTTGYAQVAAGHVKLDLRGGDQTVPVEMTLADGSVYSLIVLDKDGGLSTELRLDASGPAAVPFGGVATGAGGTAGSGVAVSLAGGGLLVLAALLLLGFRRRVARR